MVGKNRNDNGHEKTYRPWVGVVLSFFIAGASQFIAGKKLVGMAWYFIILLLGLACLWGLVTSLIPNIILGLALWIVMFVLWIVMLIKSYQPIPRLRWSGWMIFIFLTLLLPKVFGKCALTYFGAFHVPTGAMSPTIRGRERLANGGEFSGDHIFVERCAYWFSKPQRGDIVVFETKGIPEDQRDLYRIPPGEIFVKRVGGVPGDVLSIQNGHLYNHGQIISEPPGLAKLEFSSRLFASQTYLTDAAEQYSVPDGGYFVIGDNTTNSLDSRFYGAVLEKDIIGRVSKIYWPLSRAERVQ